MTDPKATKPDSPAALRVAQSSLGKLFHGFALELSQQFGARMFTLDFERCSEAEQDALDLAGKRFAAALGPPDTSTESGLPVEGIDSITVPFPKPTKPTK